MFLIMKTKLKEKNIAKEEYTIKRNNADLKKNQIECVEIKIISTLLQKLKTKWTNRKEKMVD